MLSALTTPRAPCRACQAVRINPTTRLEDFLKVEEELVFWYNADRALFELFEQGMEWAGKKGEWSTLCAHALPRPLCRLWLCCPDLCCLPSSRPPTRPPHTRHRPVLLGVLLPSDD